MVETNALVRTSSTPGWEPVGSGAQMFRADYRYGSAGVATCSAVKLGGGRLALVSPPGGAQAPALYDDLDRLGEVSMIIAPNAYHRVGLPMAAARYPGAGIFAPETALKRVGAVLPRAPRAIQSLGREIPPELEIFAPPHMKHQDTIVRVHTPEGALWTLHDIILNMADLSTNPVERWVLGLLGYKKGLRINRFGLRLGLLADKPAFSRWLVSELERLPPAVFVPGHGPVIRERALLERLPELAVEMASL